MGFFDNFTPDPNIEAPVFDLMPEGTYRFKIKSIDSQKAVLENLDTGGNFWQFLREDTLQQLEHTFETRNLIGAEKELEVKHTEKDGKVYANLKLRLPLPEPGKYRARIISAEEKKSSNGKDMLSLKLELSGSKAHVFHNFVKPDIRSSEMAITMSHANMNAFINSFEKVDRNNLNPKLWEGCVGGVLIAIEPREYNGKTIENAVVKKWLSIDEQRDLPTWGGSAPVSNETSEEILDDYVPF